MSNYEFLKKICREGNLEEVENQLKLGVTFSGERFKDAVYKGKLEVARVLLDSTEEEKNTYMSKCFIDYSCHYGNEKSIDTLIEEFGFCYEEFLEPGLITAAYNGRVNILKYFQDKGADLKAYKAVFKEGCRRGRGEVVNFLLSSYPDLSLGAEAKEVCHSMLEHGHIALFKVLVKKGILNNEEYKIKEDKEAFYKAYDSYTKEAESVKYLVKNFFSKDLDMLEEAVKTRASGKDIKGFLREYLKEKKKAEPKGKAAATKGTKKKYALKTIDKRLREAITEKDDEKFEEYLGYALEDKEYWAGNNAGRDILLHGTDFMYDLFMKKYKALKDAKEIRLYLVNAEELKKSTKSKEEFIERAKRVLNHTKMNNYLLGDLYKNIEAKELWVESFVQEDYDFLSNLEEDLDYLSRKGFREDSYGISLFQELYEKKDIETLKLILKKTKRIITPAKVLEENNQEFLNLYKEQGVDLQFKYILLEGCALGYEKAVEKCLEEHSVSLKAKGFTAAVLATLYYEGCKINNKKEFLEKLINHGINEEEAFNYVQRWKNPQVLKSLSAKGLDISPIIQGENLYKLLSETGDYSLHKIAYAEALIELGLETNTVTDEMFKDLVSYGCKSKFRICKLLVLKGNKDINLIKEETRADLLLIAIEALDIEGFQLIASEEILRKNKEKLFARAAKALEYITSPYMQQKEGERAAEQEKILKEILRKIQGEENSTEEDLTAELNLQQLKEELEDAIAYEKPEEVKNLLNKADLVAAKNKEGRLIFEEALHNLSFAPGPGEPRGQYDVEYEKAFEMVKAFLDKGAIERIPREDYRKMVLSYTIYKNHIEAAKIILEKGGDPNEKKGKKTFLEENLGLMTIEMFKLLQSHGMKLPKGKKQGQILNHFLMKEVKEEEFIKSLITEASLKELEKDEYLSSRLCNCSEELVTYMQEKGLKVTAEQLKEVNSYRKKR